MALINDTLYTCNKYTHCAHTTSTCVLSLAAGVSKHSCLLFLAQVMQFGRIDGNAYILDFQYPFSAVQAFAVALANVTQRLK